MPNEKNLIPYQFTSAQSREEAARNGAKGGRASGEARRRKRDLKACMDALLDLPVASDENYNALAAMGFDPGEIDNRTLLTAALFQRAVKGDVAAFREIRDLTEQECENENGILDDILKAVRDIE